MGYIFGVFVWWVIFGDMLIEGIRLRIEQDRGFGELSEWLSSQRIER